MPAPSPLSAPILAAVALGGAIGSTARFATSYLLRGVSAASGWPIATLLVNVVGSAALGWMLARASSSATPMVETTRAFVVVGILGGFTTFSAFSGEVLGFLHAGQLGRAAGYAMLSVGLSVGVAALAFAFARGAA